MNAERHTDAEPPPAPAAEPLVGVLAALPRARPQRTSPRRAAARAQAQSETAKGRKAGSDRKQATKRSRARTSTTGGPAEPKKSAGGQRASAQARKRANARAGNARAGNARAGKARAGKQAVRTASRAQSSKARERAPRQGYEPEEEIEVELGSTVHPPSGGELIESIADIFGELAGAGAAAGGRLLKDALSIFRRP
jgi:hypothetical protein